ncbi:MAG: DUF4197 domain-containing protein [Betaproteobacteria bacterium]|nr:DUF4197 domain-containing protein [Betaproteobacteria bacterium]
MYRNFVWSLVFIATVTHAGTLDELTSTETTNALKEALLQGAAKPVARIGTLDGFFGNPKIKIPLPENFKKADSLMRKMRMGKYSDELILTMNRAAESAAPEAKTLLFSAVKSMTIADAKTILTGADNAATQYFRTHTADALKAKFLPIVAQATERLKLAQIYDKYAGKATAFGLLKPEQSNLNDYVTEKALDGLYVTIAEEEKAIRANPVKQTTNLLKKVFGVLIQ